MKPGGAPLILCYYSKGGLDATWLLINPIPMVRIWFTGGLIAATWAALMNFGMDGYTQMTKNIFKTLEYIVKGLDFKHLLINCKNVWMVFCNEKLGYFSVRFYK